MDMMLECDSAHLLPHSLEVRWSPDAPGMLCRSCTYCNGLAAALLTEAITPLVSRSYLSLQLYNKGGELGAIEKGV